MRIHSRKHWVALAVVVSVFGTLAGCKSFSSDAPSAQPMGFTQQVTLSGANEVPPVATQAAATGSVTINADRSVSARIVATDMVATAAHIHMGAAGTNGPVIVPFMKTADNTFVADASIKLTPEQYAAFKAGNTYVNAHSEAHKGGEIRAQLKGN
jgi:P2-related tail formation protein